MRWILATEEGIAEAALGGSKLAWYLVAAAVLIALNAFYVAYEFAILAAKRSTFETGRLAESRTGKAVLASMSDLSMQLAGAQLGITMASLALGYVAEPAFETIIERVIGMSIGEDLAHGISIAAALSIATFLHLVIGEMVPKNIAIATADRTMRMLVLPYRVYLFVFRPFIVLLNGLANAGVRLVGVEPRNELVAVHSASELAALVSHSSEVGTIEADDAELLTGALEFARRPVGEVATPLDDWATLRVGATLAQAERVVASSGQERIPIGRADRTGQVSGYIHARDLLMIEPARRAGPIDPALIRRMAIVRQEWPLVEVLRTLRRVKRHMAVVVDSSGDPLSIISIEGVIRALVQPVRDPS